MTHAAERQIDWYGTPTRGGNLAVDLTPDGRLTLVSESPLSDDPDTVGRSRRENLRAMLEEDFDALILAYAEPVLSDGQELLR